MHRDFETHIRSTTEYAARKIRLAYEIAMEGSKIDDALTATRELADACDDLLKIVKQLASR
jgi:hypothetical protein